MLPRKVWTRRTVSVAVVGLIVVLAATGWMLRLGTRGAEIANVWALPVAVVGLAATLFGWSSRPRANDPHVLASAARTLASHVAEREAIVQQRLLADTGEARPADIGFAQSAPGAITSRTDGGDMQGSLDTIAAFYGKLRRGRLLVLGEPGAGKTVMATRIVLDLARAALSERGPGPDNGRRVPVRLSLPALPPELSGRTTRSTARDRLDRWIAGHLVTEYGQTKAVAQELVAAGWILPILDGLDEMDAIGTDPVRARSVISALNRPTGPTLRPMVVTCRTANYQQIAAESITIDVPRILQDTTTVVLQPLTVDQVVRWLAHRFPDPTQPDSVTSRWQPIVKRIKDRPTGALATRFISPLRMYLAVSAYQLSTSAPREMLKVAPADLDLHLFTRLVPALATHYPRPNGERYDPDEVTRWLATLAQHLIWIGAGDAGVELNLYDLWQSIGLPGRPRLRGRRPGGVAIRWTTAGLYAGITVLPLAIVLAVYSAVVGHELPGPVHWLFAYGGVGFAELSGLCLVLSSLTGWPTSTVTALRRLDLTHVPVPHVRLPSLQSIRAAITGWKRAEALGVSAAVLGFMATFLLIQIPFRFNGSTHELINLATIRHALLAAALAVFLVASFGSPRRTRAIDRPSRIIREVVAYDIMVLVTSGVVFGFVSAVYLTRGRMDGQNFAVGGGPLVGFAVGFAFGLAAGLLSRADSPWPRYALTVITMAKSGRLPPRPAAFLDWAYDAGLLRLSGATVQFRHQDIETWAAAAHPPVHPLIYFNLAARMYRDQRPAEAERTFGLALTMTERLAAAPRRKAAYSGLMIELCIRLGDLAREAGRDDDAERLYRRALDIEQHVGAPRPRDPFQREIKVNVHERLALIASRQGDQTLAAEHLTKAIDALRKYLQAEPENVALAEDLADLTRRLAESAGNRVQTAPNHGAAAVRGEAKRGGTALS